jgi:hypothetical protein
VDAVSVNIQEAVPEVVEPRDAWLTVEDGEDYAALLGDFSRIMP